MRLSDHGVRLVSELAKRRPASLNDGDRPELRMAAKLREFFYPKQRAFFCSTAKRKATSKTRRAGATSGGCRELLARAIEMPGFRATYGTTTRDEARKRAWKNDTKTGLVDLLEQFGEPVHHKTLTAYSLGGVIVEVRDGDLILEFANGSQIELFGADHEKAQSKRRGVAKHVFWIDEAQDFPFLDNLLDAVIGAGMRDFGGEIWVSGTPGRDCVGRFYDLTKDEDEGRLPGWEVHVINVTDNPFFGHVVEEQCDDGSVWWVVDNLGERHGPWQSLEDAEAAAIKVRWEQTAGAELRERGWKGDEPDFVREWLGRWVKEDARFVYPIHSVPRHVLVFAPQRLRDNPFHETNERFAKHPDWYDHDAATLDLPRPKFGKRPYQWMFAIGVDFGYSPDPIAFVVWAFCGELTDVYEMFSWKCTQVATDDQGAYIKLLWEAIGNIAVLVGDPAGKQDDFEVWRSRMNIPIDEANKRGKNTLEEFLADDIRRGRVHLRENSPLHTEMKHLVYLPTKQAGKPREVHKHRKVNGVVHGDHNCDAARYSYSALNHYLSKEREDKPKPGSSAAYKAEEKHLEDKVLAEDARIDALAERDELAERDSYGGYGW